MFASKSGAIAAKGRQIRDIPTIPFVKRPLTEVYMHTRCLSSLELGVEDGRLLVSIPMIDDSTGLRSRD